MARLARMPWLRSGRGWYVTDGTTQRRVGDVGETLADVMARLEALEGRRGNDPERPDSSVGVVVGAFLAHYGALAGAGVVAVNTIRSYRNLLGLIPLDWHGRPVSSLAGWEVAGWIDRLGGKPRTRHHRGRLLKQVTAWAMSEGRASVDPLAGWKPPKGSKLRKRVPTDAEVERFLECAPRAVRELLTFLRDTGARVSEACGARSEHLEGDRLVLRTHKSVRKSGERVIWLPPDWIQRLGGRAGWLFVNTRGKPWLQQSVSFAGRVAAGRAGLAGRMTCHSLRHWYATRMLKSGVDAATVAGLLGHSSPAVTLAIYAGTDRDEEHLRAVVRRMAG
jgi:integrase/recombinase XerD